jgi:hypothetical protein
MGVEIDPSVSLKEEYRIRVSPIPAGKRQPRLLFGTEPFSLVGSKDPSVPLSLLPSELKSIALWLDRDLDPTIVLLPRNAKSVRRMWGVPGS